MKHGDPSACLWGSAILAAVLVGGCGDDTIAGPGDFPPPEGPSQPLRIQRTVGYFSSEPEGRQAGDFFYDAEGRLERYEFGELRADGLDVTIRKEFLYRDDGSPWGNDTHIRQADGTFLLTRVIRYAYDTERNLPIEVHIESLEERTGNVIVETIGVGYDRYDRVVEIRNGPQTITYEWGPDGNVVRVVSDDIRFLEQTRTLEYGQAWNPFAEFPLFHGTHQGIIAPDFRSLHLSEGWENRVEGQDGPASWAEATVVTNEFGYPERREYTVTNATDPDLQMGIVTEYSYLEPSP